MITVREIKDIFYNFMENRDRFELHKNFYMFLLSRRKEIFKNIAYFYMPDWNLAESNSYFNFEVPLAINKNAFINWIKNIVNNFFLIKYFGLHSYIETVFKSFPQKMLIHATRDGNSDKYAFRRSFRSKVPLIKFFFNSPICKEIVNNINESLPPNYSELIQQCVNSLASLQIIQIEDFKVYNLVEVINEVNNVVENSGSFPNGITKIIYNIAQDEIKNMNKIFFQNKKSEESVGDELLNFLIVGILPFIENYINNYYILPIETLIKDNESLDSSGGIVLFSQKDISKEILKLIEFISLYLQQKTIYDYSNKSAQIQYISDFRVTKHFIPTFISHLNSYLKSCKCKGTKDINKQTAFSYLGSLYNIYYLDMILNKTSDEFSKELKEITCYEIIKDILPIISSLNLQINYNKKVFQEKRIKCLPSGIQYIILELCINATNAGAKEVKLKVSDLNNSYIKFEVINNGPAMNKDKIEEIFRCIHTMNVEQIKNYFSTTRLGFKLINEILRKHNIKFDKGNIISPVNEEKGVCIWFLIKKTN